MQKCNILVKIISSLNNRICMKDTYLVLCILILSRPGALDEDAEDDWTRDPSLQDLEAYKLLYELANSVERFVKTTP